MEDELHEVWNPGPKVEIHPHIVKNKLTASVNYRVNEGETLWYARMNISLDVTVGADQTKKTFWKRIEEYYAHNVPTTSNYTQGSIAHR